MTMTTMNKTLSRNQRLALKALKPFAHHADSAPDWIYISDSGRRRTLAD
jgi:hypothetical protein